MQLIQRPRRLRMNETIRKMVRENQLSVTDLIYPMFVRYGENIKNPVPSMPGVYQYSLDLLPKALEEVVALKIPAILLFGLPATKDEVGSGAYADDGIIQQAVRLIKKHYPDLYVITDV